MNTLKDILSDIRRLYAARHEPENISLLAAVYWRTLLFLMVVLLVATVSFGVTRFSAAIEQLGVVSTAASETLPPVLSRTELQHTLRAYEERSAAYEALRRSAPAVRDPSR